MWRTWSRSRLRSGRRQSPADGFDRRRRGAGSLVAPALSTVAASAFGAAAFLAARRFGVSPWLGRGAAAAFAARPCFAGVRGLGRAAAGRRDRSGRLLGGGRFRGRPPSWRPTSWPPAVDVGSARFERRPTSPASTVSASACPRLARRRSARRRPPSAGAGRRRSLLGHAGSPRRGRLSSRSACFGRLRCGGVALVGRFRRRGLGTVVGTSRARRQPCGRGASVPVRPPAGGATSATPGTARSMLRRGGAKLATAKRHRVAEAHHLTGAARWRRPHEAQRHVAAHVADLHVRAVRRVRLDDGRSPPLPTGWCSTKSRNGSRSLTGPPVTGTAAAVGWAASLPVAGTGSAATASSVLRRRPRPDDVRRLAAWRRPSRATRPGGGLVGIGIGRLASLLAVRREPAPSLFEPRALRLTGPFTGTRFTNTQPTCGTGLPPIRRPSSKSHG